MIDTTEVDQFMDKHRNSCTGSFRTYSWFGMSWEGSKAYTHVQCITCGKEYLSNSQANGSFGSVPERKTKNLQKQDTHEKSISTRKIRNWKVRTS